MKQRASRLLGTVLATALLVSACDDDAIIVAPPGTPLPFNLATTDGSDQLGVVGQALADPIVVTASYQFGNVLPGATVTWAIDMGPADTLLPIDASLSASSTTTDDAGETSVIWTLSSVAGFTENSVIATVGAGVVTGPNTSTTFTARANSDVDVLTTPAAFVTATMGLGVATTTIDFTAAATGAHLHPGSVESIDGHSIFDLDAFTAGTGITISNAAELPFYIAPGGLAWNASNSLSVAQFPADPSTAFGAGDNDGLTLDFATACLAVAFVMVHDFDTDGDITRTSAEWVRILDASEDFIAQLDLPDSLATDSDRAFLGIVSSALPITTLVIQEAAGDGKNVTYDDIVCIT